MPGIGVLGYCRLRQGTAAVGHLGRVVVVGDDGSNSIVVFLKRRYT